VFQVVATGVPVGLGSHIQWDRKLSGRIAQAMMSINAVKGVEIGRGFGNTRRPGHDIQDIVVPDPDDLRRFSRTSNEAGGIEGGMSNGEPIVTYVAIKPIATMTRPLPSVDVNTGEIIEAPYHRSDVCQVPPACVVGEAMMALVLAHAMLEKFGGDHISETQRNVAGYIESHREFGTSV
jgi:chorismate synthase